MDITAHYYNTWIDNNIKTWHIVEKDDNLSVYDYVLQHHKVWLKPEFVIILENTYEPEFEKYLQYNQCTWNSKQT